MTTEELILSGQLELYVTGSLPPEEADEVEQAINKHPEVKREVEKVEATLLHLAKAVAPGTLPVRLWAYVTGAISGVRRLDTTQTKATNWASLIGWAAAILCFGGIFWMLKQNNGLQDTIQYTTTQNTVLKEQKENAQNDLESANAMLSVLRSKDYKVYTLPGNQAVAPNAFAKVYYNKAEQIAYIDTNGLPEAPRDKVYQVWSLIMEPLTPSSVGLIEAVSEVENGIYRFENVPDPEAFGITLEPAGGSEGPTLSQLYTLGTVGQ